MKMSHKTKEVIEEAKPEIVLALQTIQRVTSRLESRNGTGYRIKPLMRVAKTLQEWQRA